MSWRMRRSDNFIGIGSRLALFLVEEALESSKLAYIRGGFTFPVLNSIHSDLSSEKIAIKELLMDDAEFCSGRFSDFLKEIVVMRLV